MSRTIIDLHVLQTLPPSNINRDDTGSPKTAVYGGVRRARVSSQAWKRAIRLAFRDGLDVASLGVRTKRLGLAVAERICQQAPDIDADTARRLAGDLLVTGKLAKAKKDASPVESDYLMFLSNRQLERLAEAAIEVHRGGPAPDAKTIQHIANSAHSVDIAMFGRMVADITDINVEAAVQVAHALSVHAVDNEYDYFTAIDDSKHADKETGAGMIGTVEFNSSTLYRFATIDVDRLHATLGDAEVTRRAVEAFVQAFVTSMPTGKQNTFANRTKPDAVVVQVRETQPINFVGAFETAVRTGHSGSGRVAEAAEALAKHAKAVEDAFDEKSAATYVTRVGEQTQALDEMGEVVSFGQLVTNVGAEVANRLGAA